MTVINDLEQNRELRDEEMQHKGGQAITNMKIIIRAGKLGLLRPRKTYMQRVADNVAEVIEDAKPT